MNRTIKYFLGVLISVIGLYYAFRQVNFWELWISIKNVNMILIILAVFILVLSNVIRAWRWQILVKPIKEVSFDVYQRSSEKPVLRILKNLKPRYFNEKYLIKDKNGAILKKSENLNQLISKTSWNKLKLVN